MTIVVELEIDADEFVLGEVLHGEIPVRIELERVVPASKQVMPFFWAETDDPGGFEAHVRASPKVRKLIELDSIRGRILYRVEWDREIESFINGLAESGASILEATGDGVWSFRLRFDDHGGLGRLHEYTTDHDIDYRLVSVQNEAVAGSGDIQPPVSEQQYEALQLAAREGYFEAFPQRRPKPVIGTAVRDWSDAGC